MKRKIITYLLAAVMVLSPAAVFADSASDAAAEDAAAFEQVSSDAQLAVNPYDACTWVDSSRTQAKDADGNLVKGLFKAAKAAGGTGLYYAGSDYRVVTTPGPITVSDGWRYYYHPYTPGDGEFWKDTSYGTYTYLLNNHSGDYYMECLEGIYTVNGRRYYVQSNGTVLTGEGIITYDGKFYYIQPNMQGALRSEAGLFTANNGKKYYSDSTGAIVMTPGSIVLGSTYYAIQADGSICTTPGFVWAGGKLYYVSDASGALTVNKEFKVSGNKYHAMNDATIAIGGHKWGKKYYYADDTGAVRTKKGILKAGGQYFYVKSGGQVVVNKKVKYKGKTYIAGKNGVIYRGLFTWKKNLYYASDKGVVRTKAGVITYQGARYYVRKGGKIRKNALFTASGKKYCADSNGKLLSGYFYWKGKYYLTNANCVIITKKGLYSYNNHIYYVTKGGALGGEGFIEYNNKFYYVNSKGVVVRSNFTYKRNGATYTIHPNSKTGEISSSEYYAVYPEKAPKQENDDNNN